MDPGTARRLGPGGTGGTGGTAVLVLGMPLVLGVVLGATPGLGATPAHGAVPQAAAASDLGDPTGPGAPGITAEQQDDATALWGGLYTPAGSQRSGPRAVADPARRARWRRVRTVPACPGNDPTRYTPSAGASCAEAVLLCADTPAPDDILLWIFTGPPGVDDPARSQWQRIGQECRAPEPDPHPSGSRVPVLDIEDFRRLPLPAGRLRVQPPGGRVLVNRPVNLLVAAEPVTLRTRVLGFPVRVRARPVRFRWLLGDGQTLETADPGGAYPRMTTTHVFEATGPRRIRVEVRYRGEFSVAGGPWEPVVGEAVVPSPPVRLRVVGASAALVAD